MGFGLIVLITLALTGGVWLVLYWAARRHIAERQRLGQWDENGPLHPTEPDSRFPGFDPFEAGFRHAFELEHGKPFTIQPGSEGARAGEPLPIDEPPRGESGPPER